MRSALATAMAVTLLHVAGSGVSWRTAHPSDSLAKPWAVSETWDLRAVAPKGRRAVVIRFWTKGNPWWIEWLTYERGRGVGSWPEPVEPAAHSGPGVSMKDKCGRSSLRRSGSRWLLDACATKDKLSAHLVLRAVHPGLTIGPVRVSNRRAAWLSVVATGLVDGVVHTPNGAIRIRGWYGVHEHEWATYQHYESWAYVRRDLALCGGARTTSVSCGASSPSAARDKRAIPLTRSGAGSARGSGRNGRCASHAFTAEVW